MNEIDIFLELLDDEELEKLSRAIGIPVQSKSNKSVNKIRIKQKFKSGNKSFNKFIGKMYDEDLKVLTKNEFLIFLEYFFLNNYSECQKFANFLYYFPDTAQNMLPKIEENLKENKDIFNFDINFEDLDIISFFHKIFCIFDKELVMGLIDYFFKYIEDEGIVKFERIDEEKIKNYTLNDLLNKIKNTSIQNELLYKYIYIKTHDTEELLMREFIIHICCGFLMFFKPYLSKMKDIKKYDELVRDFKELKENTKILKKSIKGYEKIKKESKGYRKENENLKNIIDQNENRMQILNHKIIEYSRKNEEMLDRLNKIQTEYDNLMKDYSILEDTEELYKKKLTVINLYFNNCCDELNNKDIGVISSKDRYIVRKLYRDEVVFLLASELSEDNCLDIFEKVKVILIERDGVNSIDIRKIKKRFQNNNVQVSIISSHTDKELLEEIVKVKQKIKEEN